MKTEIERCFEVVESENGAEYARRINEFLKNKDLRNVVVEHRNRANFCAFVTFEKVTRVPENKADEYELMGVTFTCSDCPYRLHNDDGRVKRYKCRAEDISEREFVYKTEAACPYFYEQLSRGRILDEERDEEGK